MGFSTRAAICCCYFFFASGMSGASLASYSSAISYVHKLQGLPDPTNNFAVQILNLGLASCAPRQKYAVLSLVTYCLNLLWPLILPYNKNLQPHCLYSVAFHVFFRLGELAGWGSVYSTHTRMREVNGSGSWHTATDIYASTGYNHIASLQKQCRQHSSSHLPKAS